MGVFVVLLASVSLLGAEGHVGNGMCWGERCYTLTEEPANFQRAREACEALHGHVMEPNPAELMVLPDLLSGVEGNFWITKGTNCSTWSQQGVQAEGCYAQSNGFLCDVPRAHLCAGALGDPVYKCMCTPGYMRSAGECRDVDECGRVHCEHNRCVNTPGGYRCECRPGFQPVPSNPHRCELHCDSDACPPVCSSPTFCLCAEGYILDTSEESAAMCVLIDRAPAPYTAAQRTVVLSLTAHFVNQCLLNSNSLR